MGKLRVKASNSKIYLVIILVLFSIFTISGCSKDNKKEPIKFNDTKDNVRNNSKDNKENSSEAIESGIGTFSKVFDNIFGRRDETTILDDDFDLSSDASVDAIYHRLA